jgi:hypothetical protein
MASDGFVNFPHNSLTANKPKLLIVCREGLVGSYCLAGILRCERAEVGFVVT